MHSNDVVYNLFGVMESSIKTGNTCWKDSRLLDCKADDKEEDITKNSFSQLYKNEEVNISYEKKCNIQYLNVYVCAYSIIHECYDI
jgi:hypothetical protein